MSPSGRQWVIRDALDEAADTIATLSRQLAEAQEKVERLREAAVMANNRLETAVYPLAGGTEICEHCIDVARSYLQDALTPAPQVAYDKSSGAVAAVRSDAENERLRTALFAAQDMLADGHPYGHIAALLAGATKSKGD
jgi:hypothetical protein